MASDALRERELEISREVAQAFLNASTPVEVYRLALARLTPLVRASFSSVFGPDPSDDKLLKLTCAHSWPQSSARFLGQLRIRVGRGPTGRAVAEGRAVEVSDVFADPALREWWEPARELGFTSLISLPLRRGGESIGALTFYFERAHQFGSDERHILTLIADQLAHASGRAEAMDALRREADRLRVENEQMRARVAEAEASKRLREEFLSNISHELRTPLTSILGYTSMLQAGQLGPLQKTQDTALERIDSAANALLRLITDLLELSQIKLGRTVLNVAPEDAVHIAQRAAQAAGEPPADVEFTFETSAERLPLFTDGEKVAKVLQNMLTNAFKFTRSGRVALTVRSCSDDGRPAIEWLVSDTGIGIPDEDREAIFDEFRQVDGSSTRLYGGTGLGLALSRGLAHMLGGHLTVQSEQGRGSTFRLLVPSAS